MISSMGRGYRELSGLNKNASRSNHKCAPASSQKFCNISDGHILDEDRKKNAQLMENAFYNKENLNPDIHGALGTQYNNNNNMISVPEGVDADMLMKVLGNPEMAALLTSLAKSMKG